MERREGRKGECVIFVLHLLSCLRVATQILWPVQLTLETLAVFTLISCYVSRGNIEVYHTQSTVLHITVCLSSPLTHKHPSELSCTPELVSLFTHTTAHPVAPDCCSWGFDGWAHPHVLFCFVGCVFWQLSLLLKNRCEREKCFSMGRTPHGFHFSVLWNLWKVKRCMHDDYFHFIIPQCPLRGQE